MQYIDCVNQEVAQLSASSLYKEVVPLDVVEHALMLKQQSAEYATRFSGIVSPEDERLLGSRIGSTLARVATASYIASEQGAPIEYLGALSESAQEEVTFELSKRYKKLYKRSHDWIGAVDPLTVIADNDPLPTFPSPTMRKVVAQSKRAEMTTIERWRAVGSYLNVLPGSFPSAPMDRSDYSLNDVTLTQAFGRNTITDKELPIIEAVRTHAQNDEEVMEYLDAIAFDPGDSNRALAANIAMQLQNPDVVIEQIAQWEVVYALRQTQPELYERYRRYIHSLWPKGDFYPTYAVKADSIAVMDDIGAYNPIEFAHPDMMVRARAILGRQGVWADILAADIPFDAQSVQAQTRGPVPWTIREAATRVEHVLFNRVKF